MQIKRTQPTLPTDQDIIRFVDEFWPDLHLVQPTHDLNNESDGHTYFGMDVVLETQVQIFD
jgi:hypothetical protein